MESDQPIRPDMSPAVRQTIRTVGHDIRNKLGVMKNSIYYLDLKLGRGDPKVQKHLRIMGREMANANRMVADLMDFALSKEPALRQTDIEKVVAEALSEASLPDRWKMAVSLDDDLPPVMADAVQLQRAFTNIILRIAEGAPKGGKLQIAAREQDGHAEITFGSVSLLIPEENLAMAATPLASTGGSGLGMAVSKMLVEGHGGTLGISRLGRDGAMFVVRLPL